MLIQKIPSKKQTTVKVDIGFSHELRVFFSIKIPPFHVWEKKGKPGITKTLWCFVEIFGLECHSIS